MRVAAKKDEKRPHRKGRISMQAAMKMLKGRRLCRGKNRVRGGVIRYWYPRKCDVENKDIVLRFIPNRNVSHKTDALR